MRFGLIGKDVKSSLSKKIHEQLSDNSYELLSFSDEQKVLDFLKQEEFGFVNITIPYKTLAFKTCNELSEVAKATQVVNFVMKKNGKLIGDNTDAFGFEYLLQKYNVDVKDKDCLILGTGATSRTVKFVLNKLGAKSISFLSRNPNEENQYSYDDFIVIEKAQIIINTTPVGMNNNSSQLLVDFDNCKSLQYFIDVVYKPFKTNMVVSAKENHVKAYGGLPMLVAQAIRSNELFFGKAYSKDEYENIYRNTLISSVNLVLIGHPCAGKSTISKLLSKKYNLPLIDIDDEIQLREGGMSIPDIFLLKGENYFRELESAIIEEYSKQVGYIISLGGGSVLNKENMNLLAKNSLIFNIKRDLELIEKEDLANRPLSRNINELRVLVENRKPIYEKYADIEVNNVNFDDTIETIWRSIWNYM